MSILLTIKKMLGIAEDYKVFDQDIIAFINSVFMNLYQLGVGPQNYVYAITGESETWDEFTDMKNFEAIKSYMYLKVKLLFDPPTNSFTIEAIERQIAEREWRLTLQAERKEDTDGTK